jgi:hypothetical protein
MKKVFLLAAVLLIVGAAFAQNKDSSRQDTSGMQMMHDSMMQSGMNGMNHGTGGKMKDCIMMMNGKVMVMRGGQHMPLTQQMTLPNGTTVMPDGTVKMADGTTRMLKNEECVYMDGTMGKMGNMGNKGKMKSGKDSTKM